MIKHLSIASVALFGFALGHTYAADKDPRLSFVNTQLSFEPNVGQSESRAKFLARGAGYQVHLSPGQARFEFPSTDRATKPRSITMDLVNSSAKSPLTGESILPGKANYFPGPDKSKWRSNIPTYSRVSESGVYPGVDLAFYGNQRRLEYDFILNPRADATCIRLSLSGSDSATVTEAGDVHLAVGDHSLDLLKPVAYQIATDGHTHEPVDASYQLSGASLRFAVGKYDHARTLIIDPVLAYSQYLDTYASAVAVDSSGNTYATSSYLYSGAGYHLTKFNAAGTVVYDVNISSGGSLAVLGMAVNSSGQVYTVGETYYDTTLPTGSNSYLATSPYQYSSFLVETSADGSTVPYATYLGGTDNQSYATGVAVDSSGNAYLSGTTLSALFPVTSGAYQTVDSARSVGYIAKINPTLSGSASLVYSTFIGGPSGNGSSNGVAIDNSNNAYVTSNGPAGYPLSAGAFKYTGYQSAQGGVYVSKINATGTALVYSAYLGPGTGYGIAVDGQGDAYITGSVGFSDFPTTSGAYQTTYPGGFVVEVNPAGTAEVYSTFLGGQSSIFSEGNLIPYSIALTPGCPATSPRVIVCNAYVSGWTNTNDFPIVNAIQNTPSTNNQSAFVVELASDGKSAVLSSYLSGPNSGVQSDNFDNFGKAPDLAVDSSGNINIVGNVYQNNQPDFPITISNSNPTYGFLAKIAPTAAALTLSLPSSVNFNSEPVGVSTSTAGGTATARLSNFGSTAASISSVQISPGSIFSQSNNCGTSLAAGSFCTFNIDFTPGSPGTRSGTITIASSATNSPATISLTGTGVDQAYVQPSASSLTFGSQTVGTTSTAQTVTVTNSGTVTGSVSGSFSNGDFGQQNNCPSQLAPGASCTFSVIFTPTQVGLRTDNLYVSVSNGPSFNIPVSGTGSVSGATSTITFTTTALNFGPQIVGTVATNAQYVYVNNIGSQPITIQSITASGDYSIGSNQCGTPPIQLNPQGSCYVYVNFLPTAPGTRTGNLTFGDTATGSPQNISLTGTGLATNQNVEFYPASAVAFPDQPVGTSSNQQTIYFQNTGTSPVTVDRVLITGDFSNQYTSCSAYTIPGTTNTGSGSYSYCQVNVVFTPTAAGSRTGSLTLVDSAPGSPHTVSLSGNGISASGTISLAPSAYSFPAQAVGTTSDPQNIFLLNPGNTPVNITSIATTGDFSVTYYGCPAPPFTINPSNGYYCYVQVQFSPTATGIRAGTLTVQSSAGTQTSSLTGTGITATKTLQFTPGSSMDFGTLLVGSQGPTQTIYVQNTGSAPVMFSTAAVLSGTNAADFSLGYDYCFNQNGGVLQPNSSCTLNLNFTPGAAGSRTATLTFADSANGGTQTISLTGKGATTAPTYALSSYDQTYPAQIQGTSSPIGVYPTFYNNGTTSVTLGNLAVTGNFVVTHGYDSCSGQTIAAGSSCGAYLQYAPSVTNPSANAVSTGTLTFSNSVGTTLISLPLAGYSLAPTYSSYADPTTTNFTAQQVVGNTSGTQSITLYNSGNTSLTVGTLSGTDLGLAGSTAEFSIYSANGGSDGCTGQTITAGSSCDINVTFTPNATGTRTGTVKFPVTYANNTTATLTTNLSGTGVSEKNSAVVNPLAVSFVDQTVNITTTYQTLVSLTNSGNQPLNVGVLTGVNTIIGSSSSGEFSAASSQNGYDNCSNAVVQPGSSCNVSVTFTPTAAGTRTGSIAFPVTFTDHTTTSLKVTLIGTGVTATKTIQIAPANLVFSTEVQTFTTSQQGTTVTNTGNSPITIGANSITTNSTEFAITTDYCASRTLTQNQSCTTYVTFTPGSSSAGTRTGVLTIADNATGGPHTVSLSGTAITAAQQIIVSQTTVNFGNQPAGTTGTSQYVYFTNQGDSNVSVSSTTLGGTNAADFQLTLYNGGNTCYSLAYQNSLNARTTCAIIVAFSPQASATGARSATVTETDSTGTHTITLNGTVVAAGPALSFSSASLTFPSQNVGTTSPVQYFSVKNTGNANLNISTITSTNSTEFPLTSDGCSGSTLTPGQQCTAALKFAPTLGGTRTSIIKVADNATGSPQSLAVTGTGVGVPQATPSPSSLTYSNQNIGSTSSAQNVTLSNPGTDTLNIASITLTGANAGDFAISAKTCGATLAPAANCSVSVTFNPTAAGSRGASLTFTDNAGTLAGSTQNVTLSGTGVAVPTAAVTPTSLTFSSTNVGSAAATQAVTVTNSGTGSLTITSITIGGGSSSADFTQTNSCGSTLVAGSSCTITVSFKPSASGARSGTLTVTDNAGGTAGTTQTVSLSGTGAGVSSATLSPTSLAFSNQNVNSTSSSQSVTLTNSGSGALTIASVAIAGTNAGDFAQTNNCGTSVAAGGTCTLTVTFKPLAPGSRSAALTVTDNANGTSGSTQSVTLTGTGIGVPAATASPTSISFANTVVGSSSSASNVTLSNGGTGPLTVSSITLGAANPGDFSDTSNCPINPSTLAAGASCTISVTFAPTAAGSRTASLQVLDNANNVGSSQTVTLSGTGIAAVPSAGLTPASLSFNPQKIGTASGTQMLTLSNSGAAALSIASIAVGGSNAGDFAYSTTCGSTVAPSASCTIAVDFQPTATGSRTASLTVTDNSGGTSGSTQVTTLSGTGSSASGPAVVSVSPASGSGFTQTFNAVYSDSNGEASLNSVRILFNTNSGSFANACYVIYYPSANALYLENNAGNGVSSTLTPGSSGSVSNSQCTLQGTGTSATVSGNNLTMAFALKFTTSFVGQQNVYLYANENGSNNSGWVKEGTFTPTLGTPAVASVTPSSGAGQSQTFSAVYSDPNGTSDLNSVRLMLNTTSSSFANACYVIYYPPANALYLENNSGNGVSATLTPGSSSSVSNSQCTLSGAGTSVSLQGQNITLNLALTFTAGFNTQQNIYLYANSNTNGNTGWVQKGTFTP